MPHIFPTPDWLDGLTEKLNSDEKYAAIAHKWEGDVIIDIEPTEKLPDDTTIYLDLWHGKCREAHFIAPGAPKQAAFVIDATYENISKILEGNLDVMQALMTRRLKMQGNLAYLMRNVPVVLDFVRCAREVTGGVI